MIKLIKCLDEVLGKLDLAKNNTTKVCDLMSEIMENEQRKKMEAKACMLCEERKGE